MAESIDNPDRLHARVAAILEQARGAVARTINTAMVQAYWHVGREIVEVEQSGEQRAGYGDEVIKNLSKQLVRSFGKGFSVSGLKRMRQFFRVFPGGSAIGSTLLSQSTAIGSTVSSQSPRGDEPRFPHSLAWSHYLVLMRVVNDEARAFYEIEAAREAWSVRELERQIGAFMFERIAKNKTPAEVRALARDGQQVAIPSDLIKDPFVLEFLDLHERAEFHERDIEQAIIDRIEAFLLEMGKGFCFVGRQKRLTVEGDHFYVDLVFYNRLLRCFVLVDLKLGKLTHQDLGQMMMYVNYFDRTQRAEFEAKTVGIVLCSEANQAMVKITLPEDNDQIRAATYQLYLPTEAELQAELAKEREEAERVLRLADAPDDDES
jgi:predicted nuclease of restriction endonuclease-like (RecB) superfamily